MELQFLIIDPQRDFCEPNGALYVNGAKDDSLRTAAMIRRLGEKIDNIRITLDSHHNVDIAHPLFWQDSANGQHPAPFTIITAEDVAKGRYITTNPAFLKRATEYVNRLKDNSRYPLCIWPPHCLIGSWGHAIQEDIFNAVSAWELKCFAMAEMITKGSNFWTEHYSAIQADVPDPEDPGTLLNTDLIKAIESADLIAVMGQAKSHCLANTVRDIADNFGEGSIKKLWLIEDCASNVTGFENLGEAFVKDLKARGMNVTTSKEFLA
ncbi:hypothetical protein DSOUD_2881 [Desulfuromonas soudanensis]|uniref:Nicotinamidase-related amidase n=1 Tax=Desulfuromonas soudanensis TaxID=1603606 RepID=A0A0M5ILI1_9BACT|nr:hypothetical protein [Desulfuromonas soudanensis]ALC17611.1 hypothetical protein DSOUD_2881 [Desulfuromonas soudanensis]